MPNYNPSCQLRLRIWRVSFHNVLIALTAFLSLSMPVMAPADPITVSRQVDGISFPLAGQTVELLVGSPHALRLHILATPTATVQRQSIFLSVLAFPKTSFAVIRDGSIIGLKTLAGELQVDTETLCWRLFGPTGLVLADWAPLPALGTDPSSTTLVKVGPSPAQSSPLYYGQGSAPNLGSLTQTESLGRTNNGSTSLPQYWSTAGYGALLITADDNKPASWSANGAGIDWTVPGGSADLYLMPAPTLYEWTRDQAELTGFAPVPPRWAFGYFQSRWGWTDKAYIEDTFTHFRQDQLPVDNFIIDFEWYTTTPDYDVPLAGDPDFVDFGWNPALFPDPVNQLAAFRQQGLNIIGIRKPRLGNIDNLIKARANGWILPPNPDDPNSDNIRGRNLDFSQPAVQTFWQDSNRKFVEAGMPGFWNDEGETNFSEYSYWNLTEIKLFHDVDPNARFWSINRAFAPGLQRFGAAAWTGDIYSDWDNLAATPGELLSYGLSGMCYSGCDIGGFSGTPTPDLLTRWIEAGTFFPIDRTHSANNVPPHFPWLYGADAENAIRKALDLRYQLIPYYYSLAFDTWKNGAPIMRPLVMEFPNDPNVSGLTSEWLMGAGLLAAPILSQDGNKSVYIPAGQWYNFGTSQTQQGPQTQQVSAALDQIPLYVRAGTILPLGPVLQYTGQPTNEPLILQVYPGQNGAFNLIEDDGKTLAYQSGAIRKTAFAWDDDTKTLKWTVTDRYRGANVFKLITVVYFGPLGPTSKTVSPDKVYAISFK
jgi:alpha-glucosidase